MAEMQHNTSSMPDQPGFIMPEDMAPQRTLVEAIMAEANKRSQSQQQESSMLQQLKQAIDVVVQQSREKAGATDPVSYMIAFGDFVENTIGMRKDWLAYGTTATLALLLLFSGDRASICNVLTIIYPTICAVYLCTQYINDKVHPIINNSGGE